VLEDMLRMHVMHQPKKWEDYLPLVEFSYNNGYQESLKNVIPLFPPVCKYNYNWPKDYGRLNMCECWI
jgi:hypothetical protein